MKKLTISIVNYNSGHYLLNCLDSLKKNSDELDFDVFVVDNSSTDKSFIAARNKFPEFTYLKNKENLGFGKAHNLVLKNAKTPYVLTLNPDTLIPKGTLKFMIDFIENNSDISVATCKIEKEDGSLDKASHRGFPTLKASFNYFFLKNDKYYHLTDNDMTKIHEVDSVVGAFMLIRKSTLEKVGYFDEEYFLYGEDLDLCFRIKEAGYKVMYVPNVKIMHAKGISSGIKKHSSDESIASSSTRNLALDSFYETMKIFYKKHYSNNHNILINKIVYAGIDLKWKMAKRKLTV